MPFTLAPSILKKVLAVNKDLNQVAYADPAFVNHYEQLSMLGN